MKRGYMRKILIIIVNIFIIAAILFFVVIYSRYESRASYQRQIEYFENTTVTMERVTENYLEGEQRICDVWSRYINNSSMTMEEAIGFIRNSHVLENTSAHLIALDTLEGLSTRPKQDTSDDYAVSYERVGLFKDTSWISEIGDAINAILLRVIPISALEQKWVFPQTELENVELSIIDASGDYILKGSNFKNSSLVEFYKSYNKTDTESSGKLIERITS